MIGRLKIVLAGFFLSIAVSTVYAGPVNAQFDFFKDTCKGAAASSPTCKENAKPDNENPLVTLIRTVANVVAIFTGIAAVIMIILGGFNLVTSGGNSEAVGKGRRRIIFSLVGVAVAALAWTITRLITDRVLQ